MNKKTFSICILSLFLAFSANAALTIQERLAQYAPYDLTDPRVASLSANDKKVIFHLIKAGEIMNLVLLQQLHPKGVQWLEKLEALAKKDPTQKPYLDFYKATFSPFDPFNHDWYLPEGFTQEKWEPLEGGNVFSISVNRQGVHVGVKAADISAAVSKHSKADQKQLLSPFTAVMGVKRLKAIPFSKLYSKYLSQASDHLRKAAKLTTDPALKALCLSKIEAFKTNRFDELEDAWIKSSNSPIQLVIGPYEEIDDILGTKRGFQTQIALKDEKTSKDLEVYLKYLDTFQKNLPQYEKYAKEDRKLPYFTAVNQIYLSGDSRRNALAMAEHLPNSTELWNKYGHRQLFFLNVLKGKCETILLPIANIVMNKDQLKYVTCDSNTKFTIHHEMGHGLGPANFTDANGEVHPITEVLGPMAGPVEEAKADTVGLLDRQYLILNGEENEPDAEMEMYATYTANFFRSVRFGGSSPHKRGVLFQFNLLKEKGAITFDQDGKVRFNRDKMRAHIRDVVDALIEFQLAGDPKAVETELDAENNGKIQPEMKNLLDKISDAKIARDLYPHFSGADQIVAEYSSKSSTMKRK